MEEVKIFGDFFGVGEVEELEQLLIGTKYDRSAIAEKLQGIDIAKYFGGITVDDFLHLIY